MKTNNNLKEVNGTHYECLKIEPVQLFSMITLTWFQAEPIKYLSRFWNKNGITDLDKAIHIMSMANDMEIKGLFHFTVSNQEFGTFMEDYLIQFSPHFELGVSEKGEKTYDSITFNAFQAIFYSLFRSEWDKAIKYTKIIKTYFYGE